MADIDQRTYDRRRKIAGPIFVVLGLVLLASGFVSGDNAGGLWPWMPIIIVIGGVLGWAGFGSWARDRGLGHYADRNRGTDGR